MPTESTQTPTPPAPHPTSNRFFEWMRGLGIVRQPGWIGGVCAGVAARLGIDAIIVRGIVVVLAVFGGPALLLYAAAWLLLPDSDDRIHLERLARGQFEPAVIGVGVLFLLALIPMGGFWFTGPVIWRGLWSGSAGHILWVLAVIGAIVWFVIWASRRPRGGNAWPSTSAPSSTTAPLVTTEDGNPDPAAEAPTPPPAPDSTDADELAQWKVRQTNWKVEHDAWKARQAESERVFARDRAAEQRRARREQNAQRQRAWADQNRRTRSNPLYSLTAIGAALVAGTAVTLALGAGDWTITAALTGMAVTLGVLGLAIVINGFRGKRSGGASGVAILVTIALIVTSLVTWVGGTVIQNHSLNWSPTYSSDTARRTVINGSVELDLTGYFGEPAAANADGYDSGGVELFAVNGPVTIIVPADEASTVTASSVNGSISMHGDTRGGPFAARSTSFVSADGTAGQHRDIRVTVWAVNGNITVTQADK